MSNSAINHCGQLARNPLVQAIHAALFLGASSGHAATFTVTNQNDAGAGSLREAIAMANGAPGADTIDFDPGVSTITLSTGQLEVSDELTITSTPPGGVTIDGGGLSRVLAVINNASPLTLENVTITNGATTVDGVGPPTCAATDGHGAGICSLSTLTLTNCVVSNNSTTGESASGGGIHAYASSVSLTDSTVSGNTTAGQYGGGAGASVYGTGAQITLSDSVVSGNSTGGYVAGGGGLYVFNNTPLTLTNSMVSNNSTTGSYSYGGGIFGNGAITISNSTVSGNTTTGINSGGGGIVASFGSLTVSNSTVSGNSTAGIYAGGGGIFAVNSPLTLSNTTVSGNSVTGANVLGGGINAYPSPVTLSSSILAGNTDTGGGGNFYGNATSPLTVGDSLFGDDAIEITTDNGNNVLSDAPGLAALADNGCADVAGAVGMAACVQTQALLPGSPALDAGNDNGLSFDQRGSGFPRVGGAQADIGAFEISAAAPAPSSGPEEIPVMGSWGLLAMLSSLLALLGLRRSRSN